MLDINNIPYDDQKAWTIIKNGHTSGIFQLETGLGKTWAKKIKPSNIDELSILLSLLRPACLNSGMTEEYAKTKNREKEQQSFGDLDVDKILERTKGIMVFQEQLMSFGSNIAWKDKEYLDRLVITDSLRKGIGKKDSKLIQQLKKSFIDGCIKNGKSEELANKLFEIIENSGRYAFNDAHAKKYAHISYKTAYLKANFPYQFYSVYLTYSKEKQKPKEEINNLISEARMLGIDIRPPNILIPNKEFRVLTDTNNNRYISYGLSHIKNISKSDIEVIQQHKPSSWKDLFILHFDDTLDTKLRKPAVESLILSGACDSFQLQRNTLLEIFKVLSSLSNKEISFVINKIKNIDNINEIKNILKECYDNVCTIKRKDILKSEINLLNTEQIDSNTDKALQEEELLGISMTCSAIDDKDVEVTVTCKECWKIKNTKGKNINLHAVLNKIKPLVVKKGKSAGRRMAMIDLSDKSGSINVAVFPEQFDEYENDLIEQQCFSLQLEGTNNGWMVKKMYKI